ncbi:uncharacterized protein LOC144098892 isoform X3 [Amblyomma americanum]
MEMFSASSNVKKRTRENNIIQQGEMKLLAVAFVFVLVAGVWTQWASARRIQESCRKILSKKAKLKSPA